MMVSSAVPGNRVLILLGGMMVVMMLIRRSTPTSIGSALASDVLVLRSALTIVVGILVQNLFLVLMGDLLLRIFPFVFQSLDLFLLVLCRRIVACFIASLLVILNINSLLFLYFSVIEHRF